MKPLSANQALERNKVSIPKRVSEVLKLLKSLLFPYCYLKKVSIPKRVSEVLKLKECLNTYLKYGEVSIPKRVSEVLKLKSQP